ncbi:E3 ubiquitin-protein ligase TRIM36 [Lingula anatina]|uniref:E3 ubiquitin-protein ligase TRIM36 n=1 Tax=Lingula anatina TaxID=7574 RepID=A0A1S3IUN5_LINAN|nr:E3 ubiquitin-protein ligase TRIM36 [Lingula anatina]|eukprot:XP_013401917.1 E3 ubiquitin-protein ligase TRIM36 [Lingula anatina]
MAAAAASLAEDDDSLRAVITEHFVNCPICFKEYDEPTSLPCLHSYCKGCLKTHVGDLTPGRTFSCPVCQRETRVPTEGLEGFSHNFYIESLQDTLLQPPRKRTCGACALATGAVVDATSKCISCHEYLCEQCAPYHCRTKFTKDHKIFTLEQLRSKEYKAEIQELQIFLCPDHKDEAIKYFCEKCQRPICRDCKILLHDDHKCISLDAAAESVTQTLQTKLDHLEKKFKEEDELLLALEKNTIDVEANIKQRAVHLHSLVDQQEKVLMEKVHAQKKSLDISLEHRKTNKGTVDLVKGFLGHASPGELLMMQQQLCDQMDNLQSSSSSRKIPPLLSFQLQTRDGVEEDLFKGKWFGDIVEVQNLEFRTTEKKETDIWNWSMLSVLEPQNVVQDSQEMMQMLEKPSCGEEKEVRTQKMRPPARCVQEFNTNCKYPGAIVVTGDQKYAIADFNRESGQVCVYLQTGEFDEEIIEAANNNELDTVQGLCHLPSGRTVISDYENDKIFVMSKLWKPVTVKCIDGPCGVAVNSKNHIAVAQMHDQCITMFDIEPNGKMTEIYLIEPDDFPSPFCLAYTSEDFLVVGHVNDGRVDILSPSGDIICHYTGPSNDLKKPQSICVDRYDNIYIADRRRNCIHIISPEGQFIQYFETEMGGVSFRFPWGLAIDQDGDLVVGLYGGKVKVFSFLE